MNKRELTAAVAERTGTTIKAAEEHVAAFFAVIGDTVASGEQVAITGFGKFERVQRPERQSRNPATGERITVPATYAPKFRAGEVFKSNVKTNR
jgi:DNA-binding protein HU-beta